MDASKHSRSAGTAVFMQKGSTLKVMEEFNIQGKQTSFYKYCPGTFGYILVDADMCCILVGNQLHLLGYKSFVVCSVDIFFYY